MDNFSFLFLALKVWLDKATMLQQLFEVAQFSTVPSFSNPRKHCCRNIFFNLPEFFDLNKLGKNKKLSLLQKHPYGSLVGHVTVIVFKFHNLGSTMQTFALIKNHAETGA